MKKYIGVKRLLCMVVAILICTTSAVAFADEEVAQSQSESSPFPTDKYLFIMVSENVTKDNKALNRTGEAFSFDSTALESYIPLNINDETKVIVGLDGWFRGMTSSGSGGMLLNYESTSVKNAIHEFSVEADGTFNYKFKDKTVSIKPRQAFTDTIVEISNDGSNSKVIKEYYIINYGFRDKSKITAPYLSTPANFHDYKLSRDKYVFIDTHTFIYGHGDVGGFTYVDFPLYSFRPESGVLDSIRDIEVNGDTKVILGGGVSISGTAGSGAGTSLSTYSDTSVKDNRGTEFSIDDDGTLHFKYKEKLVTLKPGEMWSEANGREPSNGNGGKLISIDTIVYYGVFQKSKIRTPTRTIRYGDINGDYKINIGDLTILRKYLLGIYKDVSFVVCDLNKDNVIDQTDYEILKRYLLREIDKLPLLD